MKITAIGIAYLGFVVLQSDMAAAQIPQEKRTTLVGNTLKFFWGNAVDSKGRPIVPISEADRTTVPVTQSWTTLAIDTGEVSGLLQWCKLDWETTMRALTARARAAGMSDKQVAFVTMVHGMTQGTVTEQHKSRPCAEADKADAAKQGKIAVERLSRDP